MKGLVFNELLDFIERLDGIARVDEVLMATRADGIYVAVGAYDHNEFHHLLDSWCQLSGRSKQQQLVSFGEHMFATLVARFPAFSEKCAGTFDLLARLDGEIHVEVLKLYPDADLPSIRVERVDGDILQVRYESHRRLASFAEGMIRGCISHFGEHILVSRVDTTSEPLRVAVFQLRAAG